MTYEIVASIYVAAERHEECFVDKGNAFEADARALEAVKLDGGLLAPCSSMVASKYVSPSHLFDSYELLHLISKGREDLQGIVPEPLEDRR